MGKAIMLVALLRRPRLLAAGAENAVALGRKSQRKQSAILPGIDAVVLLLGRGDSPSASADARPSPFPHAEAGGHKSTR